MGTTVLIDLGDDWSVGEDVVRRGYRGRGSRLAVAGALGVLALLLSVSAAPPSPVFVRLATIPVHGQITVEPGPDAVFVGEQALGSQYVSRYSISTGRRQWSTTVTDSPENLRYVASAGVLAVSTFEPVPSASRLTVLDGNTGRPLWSTPGYPLWSWPPDPPAERDQLAVLLVGDPAGARQLRMVRMRTGRAVWSRQVPAGSEVQLADWGRTGRPD
ncbi:MAG TPA: PQQ-binding-like beta-propeller repeat protein, partial [Rugosimonospora sp.]